MEGADGEIICFQRWLSPPINLLQTRIGGKNLSKKIQKLHRFSILVMTFWNMKGKDIRERSLA